MNLLNKFWFQNGQYNSHINRLLQTWLLQLTVLQPTTLTVKPASTNQELFCYSTVVESPKSSHITPVLKFLHWLKINERIEYKLLSLTYNVLTTSQPSYLCDSISVQPPHSTRSSSVVVISRPPTSSSLKITNCSFRYDCILQANCLGILPPPWPISTQPGIPPASLNPIPASTGEKSGQSPLPDGR